MTVFEEVRAELEPLMQELGSKNHVRVSVTRPSEPKAWGWNPTDLVYDSTVDQGDTLALVPQLTMLDELRMLAGRKPMWLDEALRQTGGELVSVTPNLRTTRGIDYAAAQLGGSASTTIATNIAMSNCTGTLAASDTSATTGAAGTGINWGTANATDAAAANTRGEYTALGLARAAATPAHTPTVASYTMAKTFTATSAITAVQTCGLFNSLTQGAADSATSALFVENNFTATTLANGDAITITWTINL
jgi:hypothetical protein